MVSRFDDSNHVPEKKTPPPLDESMKKTRIVRVPVLIDVALESEDELHAESVAVEKLRKLKIHVAPEYGITVKIAGIIGASVVA